MKKLCDYKPARNAERIIREGQYYVFDDCIVFRDGYTLYYEPHDTTASSNPVNAFECKYVRYGLHHADFSRLSVSDQTLVNNSLRKIQRTVGNPHLALALARVRALPITPLGDNAFARQEARNFEKFR